MQTLLFSIAKASGVRDTLRRVRSALQPQSMGPLFPDTTSSDLQRDCFIALEDDIDLPQFESLLRDIPGVENVESPPPRRLIA